ncbi:MAG: DUF924 family protein [Pseudomonadota bacterium]
MPDSQSDYIDILNFWWSAGHEKWWVKNEAFDKEIEQRFVGAHGRAAAGALDDWLDDPARALAYVILLDQFSRNLFRQSAEAFNYDAQALAGAKKAIAHGFDKVFPNPARSFFYTPFMHCEDMAEQHMSVELHRRYGEKETYHYALIHMDVIRRFGRFPHRNAVLGRETTEDEAAYLRSGGFSA